jgi:LysM repeat protein
MSLEERIEAGLRERPSDERVYSEPLAELAVKMGVKPMIGGAGQRTGSHRSAVPLLAAVCAVLVLGAGALAIVAFGVRPGANVGVEAGPSRSVGAPTALPAASSSPNPVIEATSAPTVTPTFMTYVVRSGDSLSQIAARFNLHLWEIELANPLLTDPNHLEVGWLLSIPPPGVMTPPPAAATPSGK